MSLVFYVNIEFCPYKRQRYETLFSIKKIIATTAKTIISNQAEECNKKAPIKGLNTERCGSSNLCLSFYLSYGWIK